MLRELSTERQQRILQHVMQIHHIDEVRRNASRSDYAFFVKRLKSDLDEVTRMHEQMKRKWIRTEIHDWGQHFTYRVMIQLEVLLAICTEQLAEWGVSDERVR